MNILNLEKRKQRKKNIKSGRSQSRSPKRIEKKTYLLVSARLIVQFKKYLTSDGHHTVKGFKDFLRKANIRYDNGTQQIRSTGTPESSNDCYVYRMRRVEKIGWVISGEVPPVVTNQRRRK
ncbi:MAG: hypothetical protein ACPGO5_00430 [Patescibacteria group bacterium]